MSVAARIGQSRAEGSVARSVLIAVATHNRQLLDVSRVARQIAHHHGCGSDMLIRHALITASFRAGVPMRL